MNTEPRRARNLRVAENLSDTAWSDAFLTACRERRLPGFDVPADAILMSEIDFLCRESGEAVRSRMKAGAAKAVAEYTARGYAMTVLRDLALIASITRSTDAVPDLVNHVVELYPHLGRDDTPVFPVAVDIISSLGSFPRHPRVADLFRKLLFDDSLHFRYSGMLTIGVVRADRRLFVPAVTRFHDRRSQGPQYFHDRTLMSALFKAMLPVDVQMAIDKELDPAVRQYVLHWGDQLNVLADVFLPDDRTHDRTKGTPVRSAEGYSTLKQMYGYISQKRGRVTQLYASRRKEGHG